MSDPRYTDDHEWARMDSDSIVTVGITTYAQDQLGEVVFVELPKVGDAVGQGDDAAVVESVKAAGEVKSPVSGEIVEINEALADNPALVNEDPAGEGWFYKVKVADDSELASLMEEPAYTALVESLA